jgi:hypothetical protein
MEVSSIVEIAESNVTFEDCDSYDTYMQCEVAYTLNGNNGWGGYGAIGIPYGDYRGGFYVYIESFSAYYNDPWWVAHGIPDSYTSCDSAYPLPNCSVQVIHPNACQYLGNDLWYCATSDQDGILEFWNYVGETWGYHSTNTLQIQIAESQSCLPYFQPTPTPAPTGTPVPLTYCGEISDSMMDNYFEFDGDGSIVYQDCITTPEITLSSIIEPLLPIWLSQLLIDYITELLPIDTLIEAVTICVRARDYALYLFVIRMPVEFIVSFTIILSALRFFVPSVFSGATMLGQSQHSSNRKDD